MMSGAPPSSGEGERVSERLRAAHGSVRDALGSLQNLEQLLKSIRVGPRALGSVVPAVHASCTPLLASFHELLAALAPLGAAPIAIEAFVTPRLHALEQALATATHAPLHARQRLALEAAVTRAATELETGRALVDLLERALGGPSTTVSLVEVTRSAHRVPDGAAASGYERVAATIAATGSDDVVVSPRVAAELIGIAVRMVAATHNAHPPHVQVGADGTGRVAVTVSPGPSAGEAVHLFAVRLVEPTAVSAHAAAAATHGDFVIRADGTVTMSWPAAAGD